MEQKSFEYNVATESSPLLGTEKKICCKEIPARYVLSVLGFLGFVNVYAMRVNLSVALVAMVNSTTAPEDGSNVVCHELLPIKQNGTSLQTENLSAEFNWDAETQGLILGSFFYGYVITQIPGGIIAEKFGAKWLYGIGVLVTSIFTLLTPIAARWGVGALVAARIIEGLGEGVTFPAMNALVGRWVPEMERSRLATFIFTGSPVGTVVAMAVSGRLCDSSFLGGWPSVFYVFGFSGCVWFVLWTVMAYDSPEEHPRISQSELTYIEDNRGDAVKKRLPIPWKSILTSVPVWALAITHFGQNWGNYTLLTELPTYLSNVLHFNMSENGTLSSLPYVLQAMFAWMASVVVDKFRQRGKFKISTLRKVVNSIAFFGPAACLLSVTFVGCNSALIMLLLSVAMGLNGLSYSGYNVTHVDMSPEFAGTLMGITNCIANLSGFLAPAAVGELIKNGQTLMSWGMVFVITSAMYFFTGLIYNVFCTAELQRWNQPSETTPNTSTIHAEDSNIKSVNPPQIISHSKS